MDERDVALDETKLATVLNAAHCTCKSKVRIRVKVETAAAAGHHLKLFSGSSCLATGEQDEKCTLIATITEPDAQIVETDARTVAWPPADTACQERELQQKLTVVDVAPDDTGVAAGTLAVNADGKPPEVPVLTRVASGDLKLLVTVMAPDDETSEKSYQVLCRSAESAKAAFSRPPAPGFETSTLLCSQPPAGATASLDAIDLNDTSRVCSSVVSSASGKIPVDLSGSSLANGDSVDLRVVAIDAAGNAAISEMSAPVLLVASTSFEDVYRASGGGAEAGCSVGATGGGSALALLALLSVVFRRGRAGRVAGLLAFLAAGAGVARADSGWSFSVLAGPYGPDVDAELGGQARPFDVVFDGGTGPLVRLGIERTFRTTIGDLGVAAGVGFMSLSAPSCTGEPTMPDCDRRSEVDTTSFSVLPISLSLVYRARFIADQTVIPIVPYLRVGLDAFRWWESGSGTTSSGTTFGWHAAAGLALRLDAFDQTAANSLRQDFGVSHVCLIAEVERLRIEGLGMTNRLQLSDDIWALGLIFEM